MLVQGLVVQISKPGGLITVRVVKRDPRGFWLGKPLGKPGAWERLFRPGDVVAVRHGDEFVETCVCEVE